MDKQYYYMSIAELVIPQDAPFDVVHTALNRFIDTLPILANEISENIKLMEYKSLAETLETALPLVTDIYAKVLEADMRLIIRRIERTGYPSDLVASFVANLMTLSIKLQNAQYYGNEIGHIRNVEVFTDIVHTLSSFISLIDECDYKEAHKMLSDMNVFDEELALVFDRILSALVMKDYSEARSLAYKFKEEQVSFLHQCAGYNYAVKVLAVDDAPESLSFISNVLKNHFKVFRVTNGKTALKVLKTQTISLVILDIDMPDMNGYQLAEAVRKIPEYIDIPIIFLSGNSTREHIIKAKQVGAVDFLIKPSNYEALLSSVIKNMKL